MKESLLKKYNLDKIIEKVVCTILVIWCITPFLYHLRPTALLMRKYNFILFIIIGTIGILLLTYYILKGIEKKENIKNFLRVNLPFVLFIIYMLWTWISCIFAYDINSAFVGNWYRQEGWFMYVVYGAFFTCAFFTKSKKCKEIIINVFLIVMVLDIIIINLASKGIILKLFKPSDIRVSTFDNSNHYGYYLLIGTIVSCMLFITYKNKILKTIYLIFYCILLYNLIINNTFGCYLALGVTIIMFIVISIIKKQKIILPIIGLSIYIIASIFVSYNGTKIVQKNLLGLYKNAQSLISIFQEKAQDEKEDEKEDEILEDVGSGRGVLWKYGIKFILKKPILGYGPDNLEREYAMKNINQDRPHNLIIQLATTSGLIGLVLYTGAVAIIIKRGYQTMTSENTVQKVCFFSVIAYLISAMFGNSTIATSPYFFILLGFLMSENIKPRQN